MPQLGFFSILFCLLVSIALIWVLFQSIRHHPELFRSEALGKSATTLGVLALLLIGLIGFVVLILKQS